ncbi:guanine nucleotide binding protein, alpha subunit [Phycomyces nitens]|nr:guanine nucleotide binding protein, alpha subunit [Phycomyces nitens]
MGCCTSVESNDNGARLRNDEIEKQLRVERQTIQNEVKLLLLGTGESGKSTVLKQMKLIHEGGFSMSERLAYREIIISNTIQSMQAILEAMDTLGIKITNIDNQIYADTIKHIPGHPDQISAMSPDAARAIQVLWEDSGIQEAYHRSNEYQLIDSASYYFNSIDLISDPDYVPTDQDLLQSRIKTTGITETKFVWNNLKYRMFDVGGQRSERKKWIHCFENVTAIIFLVAISEYDQVLIEDESVNRMQEALVLFDSIWNSRWFDRTSIILFLNKIDILKTKISQSPIQRYFTDYTGGDDYNAACDFFKWRFLSLNPASADKQVYTHFTCATDTNQIRFVMTAVNDIVMQTSIRNMGLV